MNGRALLLSGPIGLGHEMMVRSCTALLEDAGWDVRTLDSIGLLGRGRSRVAERSFEHIVTTVPGLYDDLHFNHLRTGSPLATLMDRRSRARLVPALRADLAARPADLVLSVFATGASAAAVLKADAPDRRTVVLCTDVTLHRLWVAEGTDLFLATSEAAAVSVRRYLPRARVTVVPPPVRDVFYDAPPQAVARLALGLPEGEPCVLVIDSGWGVGRMAEAVVAMADAGVHVLAVAGRQARVERHYRALAARSQRVHAFGFVDNVPVLMAAADAVMALPGATTCSEARVVGRPLLLLDFMPGHGRDNLLHELEQGDARVCGWTPTDIAAAAFALLDETVRPPRTPRRTERWEPAVIAALSDIGVDVGPASPPLRSLRPTEAEAGTGSPAPPGAERRRVAGARLR